MSIVGDLFEDLGAPLLQGMLGRAAEDDNAVIHYPLGVVADGVEIDAIVSLDDEEEPDPDTMQGARRKRKGKLDVSSSLTITVSERPKNRDTFLIDEELWGACGLAAGPGEGGLQTVLIEREEPISTKRTRVH